MKTAFVLSGGGAKGAFQVGVLKQLIQKHKIFPDRIDGTSTGALQAAGLYLLGSEGLTDVWLKIKSSKEIMELNWFPHIFTLGLTLNGLYSMKPLEKKLKELQARPRCEEINAEIYVTKVSLETGAIHYCHYHDDDFTDSVISSCSVPIINPPWKGFVDGGVRDQFPISKILREDFDRVICISTNPLLRTVTPWKNKGLLPILKDLIRVADEILPYETWLDEIYLMKNYINSGKTLTIYAPNMNLLDTREFNPTKIKAAIEQGYNAEPVDLSRFFS